MGNGIVRYKAEVDVGKKTKNSQIFVVPQSLPARDFRPVVKELLIFNLLGFVTAISKECQIKDLLALKFK